MIQEITGTIYVSSDGKQFIDRNECLEYEKKFNLDRVKFYRVLHGIISAPANYYEHSTYFAIAEPTANGSYYTGLDALDSFCMKNYLSSEQNGLFYVDVINNCVIRQYTRPVEITKEEFFSADKNIHEKFYFSDYPIIPLDEKRIPQI